MLTLPQPFSETATRPEEWFVFTGQITIPAVTGVENLQIPIGNDAHFLSYFFTCTYPTVDGGADDGVNRVSVTFRDDSTQRALSNNPIDLQTIATPGRIRTPGLAGDPPQSINIPGFPYFYFWEANGNIEHLLNSTSDTDLTVSFTWSGFKYPVWAFGPSLPKRQVTQ